MRSRCLMSLLRRTLRSTLFPYTTLFRSSGFTTITAALGPVLGGWLVQHVSWRAVFFINVPLGALTVALLLWHVDRKSTRLNSSHANISYAVFCLKKKSRRRACRSVVSGR